MWETQPIEVEVRNRLINELGQTAGEEKYGLYVQARKDLVWEVLREIKAFEPELTDHGSDHIANVLTNAFELLGQNISKLGAIELYCLILSILFHDTGNLSGRDNHQHKIGPIYDFVRPRGANFRPEKLIVLQVVAAHCGKAPDNSNDTLQFLKPANLDRKPVNLCRIAAILRFADELAEGPQRTSLYMNQFGHTPGSTIYHKYATATEVLIDPLNSRIALNYNIDLDLNADGTLANENDLKEFVNFIYRRILKLDQERRYARHYCSLLDDFKQVSAVLNFWANRNPIDLGLEPVVLTDLVVPGDVHKLIPDYDLSYSLDTLLARIREVIPAPNETPSNAALSNS